MEQSTIGRRDAGTASGIAVAICFALIAALVPAGVDAATHRHNIRAWHEHYCVGGDAPARARLSVAWKGQKGAVKKKGFVRANQKGQWKLCASGKKVVKGDVITATLGKAKRVATVPRLDVVVDRETGVVSGTTRPGRKLVVQIGYWDKTYGNRRFYRGTQADARGRFSVDMDACVTCADFVGGDTVEVFTVGSGKPNVFGRLQLVPYVEVELGTSNLSGAYRRFHTLTVDLLDPGLDPKAQWTGKSNGYRNVWSPIFKSPVRAGSLFSGRFTPTGESVSVGDRVQSPANPPSSGLPVLDIAVTATAATDVIRGTCVRESRYRLVTSSPSGSTKTFPYKLTAAGGAFERDVSGQVDLKKGTEVRLTCVSARGDRLTTRRTVP